LTAKRIAELVGGVDTLHSKLLILRVYLDIEKYIILFIISF